MTTTITAPLDIDFLAADGERARYGAHTRTLFDRDDAGNIIGKTAIALPIDPKIVAWADAVADARFGAIEDFGHGERERLACALDDAGLGEDVAEDVVEQVAAEVVRSRAAALEPLRREFARELARSVAAQLDAQLDEIAATVASASAGR